MNTRHLHHIWTKSRTIKPWYFLVVAVVSGVVCVFALRANNLHMIALREDVYIADQKNGDTEAALRKLQAYVTTHMSTDLNAGSQAVYPPIQLKYTYERLVRAQSDQIAQSNTQLYSEAQAECERQNPTDFSGRNRVPCIQQYVLAHNPQKTTPVPDALYKFSFVTPRWSPDLAGWTQVLSVISGLLFIVTFIADRWFRRHVT